ncbi:hypothetical protein ACFE04_017637 [Oxalis oulophora]
METSLMMSLMRKNVAMFYVYPRIIALSLDSWMKEFNEGNYSLATFLATIISSFRFKCIDLDGNGVIMRNELQFFYEEQLHRMECMAQEPKENSITLQDIKGSKLSGNVFNILFNLHKFIAFESRDPFLIRQERENPTLTEWDRFAHREYIRF